MELGLNAYTVASHLTMVAILLLLIFRVLSTPHGDRMGDVIDSGFKAAVAIAALGLIIERLYYVLARFLSAEGFNLWTMHPAPEFLSLVVGCGLYSIMIPMILVAKTNKGAATVRIFTELTVICSLWVFLSWVLY